MRIKKPRVEIRKAQASAAEVFLSANVPILNSSPSELTNYCVPDMCRSILVIVPLSSILFTSCDDKAVVGEIEKSRELQKGYLEQQKDYFEKQSLFYDSLSSKQDQLIEGHRNRFEKELNNQSEAGKNLSKIQDHLNTLVGNEQWEYLIVSYGKTSFSSVSESVGNGSSKLTAFREFSELLYGSEALSAQEKLDILGRLDWELVSVVGSIGGDQQFVLKRPRNVNRAEIELLVASELKETLEAEKKTKDKAAELYAKILAEREKALEEKKKTALVDLDAMEKSAERKGENERIFELLRQYLIESGVKLNESIETQYGEVLVKGVEINTSRYNSEKYSLSINIDGSDALVSGGREYRSSQCESVAKTIVSRIKKTFREKGVAEKEYSFEANLSGRILVSVSNNKGDDTNTGAFALIGNFKIR